ncbi:DODA-type extradiol aromatic ring-opening family dioxygenase [Halopseudomonas bauzanensis]|uniref:Aromatic ring-opening dioxygenase, catalytic subunit, LigB family n=1 Tax=Halopseudomonas bauzanensis TaxID=653930 RepID=A0A031MDK5_9GAMM|nr:class III extradiol ring-cleavage dioxygenase [Halopseudomonas bauzanensis]EZQ18121.1 aromatic ring-opening dioxygenase LigA [Halopseudomonas bauzanensis]SER85836.1 Aromatic ring-opening dioxygenase, catalytic subunit, LigB family [Halopseudomonas bauzanensis]SFL94645.1 Aromatic ring-opening dioxygenase, catalytic subunit, LigB family [Halopseudomonas bauzanensis]
MSKDNSARQPALFIPHGGGPCFFMDWDPATTWVGMGNFLKQVASTLPQRPKAIVMVSAHWREHQFSVTGHARPQLIYDYYGFPAHTYELTYPAPGQPQLAEQVAQLLNGAGMPAQVDAERGFDHGMFIPLKLMFPGADIPVIQLSLRHDLDPEAHLEAGRALAALRDDNILIVGSGMSFHNMRAYGDSRFSAISDEFDRWLTQAVQSPAAERDQLLRDWAKAPHAHLCHPQGDEEHLMPLLVAAGAGGEEPGQKVYSERVMQTTISAFRFG